jgi:hypothetical protein
VPVGRVWILAARLSPFWLLAAGAALGLAGFM